MPSFRDPSATTDARVADLLGALELDEKLSLCAGRSFWQTPAVPRLGIRRFRLADGPRGVAFHSARRRCTAFPSGIALGASWDPSLSRRIGAAMGAEARAARCQVLLGPAVNITRTPLNGRTFEYLTEDPHLNAELAVPYVQGVQSQKVAACVKHYAANNQETYRRTTGARVSERALREIYLPVFEAAVREGGAWSVMSAYNAVNGVAACENRFLLWELLREEWGFQGFVVSDWFGARRGASPEACMEAGLSLEMPGRGSHYKTETLRLAVDEGRIAEADVDRVLRGLLHAMVETGHLDPPARPPRIAWRAHQDLAREAAEAGLTLLRNDGVLPIDVTRVRTVAVLGPKARSRNCLPLWGGSCAVWPPYEITPWKGIQELLRGRVELARRPEDADVAVVVVGLSHRPGLDSEGRDRKTLPLPARQVRLIRETARKNPNTVVVLIAGGPVEMDWAEDVAAILVAWYPGMEGGRAIANALVGAVNPSGKLPVTFPRRLSDVSAHRSEVTFPGTPAEVHYEEGVFVGYRDADRTDAQPLFPFGFGLSYTEFELTDLQIERDRWEGEGELVVSATLHNRGSRAGAEVVQLYVGDADASVPRPLRELKGFRKVSLRPGASERVPFSLQARDLAFWSETAHAWVAEAGAFTIHVGTSSRDLPLSGHVQLVKDLQL